MDGKSAFHGEPAQYDDVECFQSFALHREEGLPCHLPAELEAAILHDSEFVQLKNCVCRLEAENAPDTQICQAKNRARSHRSTLVRRHLKEYRCDWVRKRRDWKILTRGKKEPKDTANTHRVDISSRLLPERDRLTMLMVSCNKASLAERKQAVSDLYRFATRNYNILYRPDEEPINGHCPVTNCGKNVER